MNSKKVYSSFFSRYGLIAVGSLLLIIVPFQSVFANSTIARRVEAFCAPTPTMPDVTSCSACHSTTTNQGPNDLTTAGMWALNGQDANFCPAATPAPPTTPPATPPTTPAPGTGMGMGTGSGSTGMGMGSGGSTDDDDDDEHEDDDDDMPMPMPAPVAPVTPGV